MLFEMRSISQAALYAHNPPYKLKFMKVLFQAIL